MRYNTLEDARALAAFAHRHQSDKAGMPYINHPERVLASVQAQGAFPYVQIAAVLHDVTEDTAFTSQMLLDLGVPEAAVTIVDLMDRAASRKRFLAENEGRDTAYAIINGRNFMYFIALGPEGQDEFYYAEIRKNPGALMVKLADIHDNTQQWRLSYLPDATQERLRVKYAKAFELLTK